MSRPCVTHILGAAAVLLSAAGAMALRCEDPADLAARVPASADLVVVIDRAGEQARSPAGRAVWGAIAGSGLLPGTAAAWAELASALDLPPGRAFDELLGQRLMIVVDQDPVARWAIVSDISLETQSVLRKRLRTAPRRFASIPVLSLEGGKFEMAIAADGGPKGRATMLLAPSESSGLFDSMVPVLTGGRVRGSMGETCGFEHARAVGPAAVLVFRRMGSGAIALGARPTGDGWDARLIGDAEAMGGTKAATIEPWSSEAFRSLEQGALLAYMGIPTTGAAGLPMTRLVAMPVAAEGVPDRQFMAIKRLPKSLLSRLDERNREVLGLTMGFENAGVVPDPIGGLAGFLEGFGLGGGVLESVERGEVHASPIQGSVRARLEPLFGTSPVVSWAYCGEADERTASWGWWLLGLAPGRTADQITGSELTMQACAAVSDRPAPESVKRRLSIGVVRPRMIDDWLASNAPEATSPPASSVMRHIDRFSWDVWVEEPGRVVGELQLRMRP